LFSNVTCSIVSTELQSNLWSFKSHTAQRKTLILPHPPASLFEICFLCPCSNYFVGEIFLSCCNCRNDEFAQIPLLAIHQHMRLIHIKYSLLNFNIYISTVCLQTCGSCLLNIEKWRFRNLYVHLSPCLNVLFMNMWVIRYHSWHKISNSNVYSLSILSVCFHL